MNNRNDTTWHQQGDSQLHLHTAVVGEQYNAVISECCDLNTWQCHGMVCSGSTNCWIGQLQRSRPPESSRVNAQVGLELGLGLGLVSPIQPIRQLALPVCRHSMSTRHINSTIFPIMYLPDLPLVIFQC